jgi:hypothetical protein
MDFGVFLEQTRRGVNQGGAPWGIRGALHPPQAGSPQDGAARPLEGRSQAWGSRARALGSAHVGRDGRLAGPGLLAECGALRSVTLSMMARQERPHGTSFA